MFCKQTHLRRGSTLPGSSLCPIFAAILLCSAAIASSAQTTSTFTVLHSFLGPEGVFPTFGVVRNSAGVLYGTTQDGGIYQNCDNEVGGGAVYKLSSSGKATTVHAFNNGADTCFPSGTLIMDGAGNLYGTTISSVFKVSSAGKFSTLFVPASQSQGNIFEGPLARDQQGNLYGVSSSGGNNGCQFGLGCGTVFKLDGNGNETVLYEFTGGTDGYAPANGMVRDSHGNLYGTTTSGGDSACQNGCGVIFKVDADGNETVLHSFAGSVDGQWPRAGLILDSAGNLYGESWSGGNMTCNGGLGCGYLYRITPSGQLTVLYKFKGGTDGAYPTGSLVRDEAGNFYGVTGIGGDQNNDGIIFELSPSGKETILHRFHGDDGSGPSGITLDSAGNIYGTAQYGGSLGQGVVFKLTR